ncbi:MAG: topoisomerase DNA-binding C4 zinc finger domain-containing protein [Gordonibacter sp.]|nr:topoisomerase DNA-binding C4 zinc finger domain-containing protein [Gordonibacter sp.]
MLPLGAKSKGGNCRVCLYATIREIWERVDNVLTEDEVADLHERLKLLTNVDEATKAAHIGNIKRNYEDKNEASRRDRDECADEAAEEVADQVTDRGTEGVADVGADEGMEEGTGQGTKEGADVGMGEGAEEGACEGMDEDAGDSVLICPRCGAVLIVRTAKKGSNAGNQFYGCSSFPRCRFTKKV